MFGVQLTVRININETPDAHDARYGRLSLAMTRYIYRHMRPEIGEIHDDGSISMKASYDPRQRAPSQIEIDQVTKENLARAGAAYKTHGHIPAVKPGVFVTIKTSIEGEDDQAMRDTINASSQHLQTFCMLLGLVPISAAGSGMTSEVQYVFSQTDKYEPMTAAKAKACGLMVREF